MAGRAIAWLAGSIALVALGGTSGPAAHGAAYTVGTAMVAVQGASKRVLTDESGMTLYYLGTDSPTRSTCTGGCAQVWPPLLSASAPTSEAPLPGRLALVKAENGSQVSYNGHLLYRFSGDTAPGQANGHGTVGQWWVATIDLKPVASGDSGSTTNPNRDVEGGGGGGGGGMGGGGY